MCVEINRDTKIVKTEKDIICYKVLRRVESLEYVYLRDYIYSYFAIIINKNILCYLDILGNESCHKDNLLINHFRENPKYVIEQSKDKYLLPYRSIPIRIGDTYYESLSKEIDKHFGEGIFPESLAYVRDGIYSYVSLKECLKSIHPIGDYVAVKCIIPKGSYYCEGKYNYSKVYVSSILKYIEVV